MMKLTLFIYICLLIFIVKGDPVKLPALATSYSTYVSINDYTTGWTFAYKEYFNLQQNKSRIEASNSTTIVDLNANVHYVTSSDGSCLKRNGLPKYLQPTYYSRIQGDQLIYLNTTIIDRGINCNLFVANFTTSENETFTSGVTFNNVSIDRLTTFNSTCLVDNVNGTLNTSGQCTMDQTGLTSCSFSVNASTPIQCNFGLIKDLTKLYNISTLPNDYNLTQSNYTIALVLTYYAYYDVSTQYIIRERVNGTANNETLDIELDWIDWTPSTDQQQTLYFIPTNCPLTNSSSPFDVPTNKTLLNATLTLDLSQMLNNTFGAVLEEKLAGQSTTGIQWHMDYINGMESLEYDRTSGGDNVNVYNLTDNTKSFTFNSFTLDCNSSVPVNLYRTDYRRSIVYSTLAEHQVKNWTYEGRSIRRRVDVDTYTTTYTSSNVTYSVRIYMFAPGWQFPARTGIYNTTSIPLAMESNTTDPTNATNVYFDVWDIYLYAATPFPANYTSRDSIGCLPMPPANYSSTVSINVQDVGISFNFVEYSIQNLYYASVGKMGTTPTDRAVIDYTQQKYTLITSTNCTNYSPFTANISSQTNIGPSTAYLNRTAAMGATTYLGLTMVRGINAMTWTTQSNGNAVTNSSNLQNTLFTFYWTRTIDGTNIPVRVMIYNTIVDTNNTVQSTYSVVVDWIMFTAATPSQSYFNIPTSPTCAAVTTLPTTFSTNLLPSRKYLIPTTLPNVINQPTIPAVFTAVMDISVATSDGKVNKGFRVRWQYSDKLMAEGIEVLYPNGTTADTYLFCYTQQMGGAAYYTQNGKQMVLTTDSRAFNILRSIGDSSIVDIFYKQSTTYKPSNYTWYRGVGAETWTEITTDGKNTTSFLWYPTDWILTPAVATNTRQPLAILNNDTLSSNITSTEVWDIVSFTPSVTLDTWGGQCKGLVPSSIFKDPAIAVGTLVAIVIIVCAIVIAVAFVVFRQLKKRGYLQAKPNHIRLDERAQYNNNNDKEGLIREEL